MENTNSINDILGDGGLQNVAILEEDSNGNTVLVGADGTIYAALPVDANGVVEGSIALRSGTVAELLAITDAGNGEVAVATDTDALVVYLGTPSVGQVYGRTTVVGEVFLSGAFQTYPDNTATKIPFDTPAAGYGSSAYLLGLVSAADDWFTAPPAAFASHFTLQVEASFSDGTIRAVDIGIEYDSSAGGDGTAWTQLALVNAGNPVANTQPGKKHRLTLLQTSGATLYSATITPIVQFRKE